MKSADIRKKYIEFFVKREHIEIPSAPLVPENDPTTLFTSSGMQPLVPYLLGQPHPAGIRLVNSQKAIRLQDIDEVGDNRHTTFFEMLGNWSLGDYFKKEQLPWIFTFLTDELGLDPKRLYVTVFEGNQSVQKDMESIKIWKEIFASCGIDAKENKRIFAYPANKNWWSRSGEPEKMPTGEPGGPDSEVFFDFGEELKLHEQSPYKFEKCHPNCDCGRFLEIANSVFMQYQKRADGTLIELPQKNVDFGGGLERMTAASIDDPDMFNTDLFAPLISLICDLSQKQYIGEFQTPMRIIADHIKAASFLLAEEVLPSNKAQGYILRRLIRRATVKMHTISIKSSAEAGKNIAQVVGNMYKNIFFQINSSKFKNIPKAIGDEIQRFEMTLNKGLKQIEKYQTIDGKIAFDLLQTFGFPYELTIELAQDRGQTIDKTQFENEFKKHQELSRTASKGMFKGGLQDHSEHTTKLHTATHLLQQALRDVLGNHVRQKGSNITSQRLRFDFSHPTKLTPREIEQVESIVNSKIKNNLTVAKKVVSLEEALDDGALTVPGATYPQKVNVYSIGPKSAKGGLPFSREVCGGPHVDFTATLGTFKIIKEEALGNNSRRIYAILT